MSRLFADGSTSRQSGRELGESRLHTTWLDLTPAPSISWYRTGIVQDWAMWGGLIALGKDSCRSPEMRIVAVLSEVGLSHLGLFYAC